MAWDRCSFNSAFHSNIIDLASSLKKTCQVGGGCQHGWKPKLLLPSGANAVVAIPSWFLHDVFFKVERDEFCTAVLRARQEDGLLDQCSLHDDVLAYKPQGLDLSTVPFLDVSKPPVR